jgi:hypothetical protein
MILGRIARHQAAPPGEDVMHLCSRLNKDFLSLEWRSFVRQSSAGPPCSPVPMCLRVLRDMFERRFSADGVKHHKPSRQAYAYVEKELGVRPSQLCLIACHTWDTLGAVAAGWEAALIRRVGNDILEVGPQPQIVGDDLNDVADQLIARHKRRA